MLLSDLGEFPLIDRLARQLASRGTLPTTGSLRLGIGDDAALLSLPEGTELVATTDALTEGVHFRRDWSRPEDVGWKALAVNVSDLGAMGARPLACLLSLAAPRDLPVRWVDRFYRGLSECAAEYGCPVAGGDTVASPGPLAISVTALGTVAAERAALRSGASAGDLLCVTGVLGESGAALALLQAGARRRPADAPLYAWHFRPRPPVAAGAALVEAGLATAMMDLSDGLASDAQRLSRASGAGLRIEAARLPISDAARRAAVRLQTDPIEWALHGGEDYQLLFTVRRGDFLRAPPVLAPLGVTATVVGEVTGSRVTLVGRDGSRVPLRPRGFAHFVHATPGE